MTGLELTNVRAFDFQDSHNDVYRIFFAVSGVIQIFNVTQDCGINFNNPELKDGLFFGSFGTNQVSKEAIEYVKGLLKLKVFW